MEKSLNAEVGARIRAEREKLGLTREKLAEQINCSYSFLTDLERGRSGPGLDNLIALADFFGVSTDFILGHEIPGDYTFITRYFQNLTPQEVRAAEKVVRSTVEMLKDMRPDG